MNLLLNKTNFDQRWAAAFLMDIIYDGCKVVIIPVMHDEGYAFDRENYEHRFDGEGEYASDLIRPFLSYGVDEKDITMLHLQTDSLEFMSQKIKEADIVFLAGEEADDVMDQLEDCDLVPVLKSFNKLLIGASAGSLVLMESFPSAYSDGEYRDGLGIVCGIDLELHYEENQEHLAHIIHSLETRRDQVLVLPDKGGILIDGLNCEFLGSAFLFDMNHLDALYEAYNTYLF